ncbi:MAG TPA: hypothetical protein DF610_07615 [Sphingobacterium sp.]|nr:hypothetical protein [Sphingobacterium sp.]
MTLRNLFPLSRIAFISQIPSAWQRYIEGDADNLAYLKTKAIIEMCAYHGVPVWIGCKEFGFNPLDNEVIKNTLMPDELHPNIPGHTWYANRIEDWLLRLFK